MPCAGRFQRVHPRRVRHDDRVDAAAHDHVEEVAGGADDSLAVDPHAALRGVVVDETTDAVRRMRVSERLAYRHRSGIAGSVDDGAASDASLTLHELTDQPE